MKFLPSVVVTSVVLLCSELAFAESLLGHVEIYDQNNHLVYASRPEVGDTVDTCAGGFGEEVVTSIDDEGMETECECNCGSLVCYEKVEGTSGDETECVMSEGSGGTGGGGENPDTPGGGSAEPDPCGAKNWEDVKESLQCRACGGYWRPANALPCYGGWATTSGGMTTVLGSAWIGTRFGWEGGVKGALVGGLTGIITGLTTSILTCDYECQPGSPIDG